MVFKHNITSTLEDYITIRIKRLDHHGIVAGVLDDSNIVSLLDKHLL
jgi:hypothetical protein